MCASTEMFCSAVVSLRGSNFQTGKGTSQISAAYKAVQENPTILPLLCSRCQHRSHQTPIPHTGKPALLARKPPRTGACLGQEIGVLRKGCRFFHFWFVSVFHRDLCAFKHFSLEAILFFPRTTLQVSSFSTSNLLGVSFEVCECGGLCLLVFPWFFVLF